MPNELIDLVIKWAALEPHRCQIIGNAAQLSNYQQSNFVCTWRINLTDVLWMDKVMLFHFISAAIVDRLAHYKLENAGDLIHAEVMRSASFLTFYGKDKEPSIALTVAYIQLLEWEAAQ